MHRLTRYSIRSLLVLVTLACLVLGWYVANRNVRQREVAAIEQLEASFGVIGLPIAQTDEPGRVDCLTFTKGLATLRASGPEWLQNWSMSNEGLLHRVVELELYDDIDDSAIPHLGKLTSLEKLSFYEDHFTTDGKARLQALLPNTVIDYNLYDLESELTEENPFE